MLAAETDGKYSRLIKELSAMSSQEIIDAGQKEEAAGNNDKALVTYMVLCNRANDDMPDKERELASLAFFRAGYINNEAGRYSKAMQAYLNGLRFCESTKEKKYAAGLYKDIGIIYNVYSDFEKGLHYLRKGEEMLASNPDPYMEYKLQTSIFFNCLSLSDRKGAEDAYSKLRKLNYEKTDLTRYMDIYTKALIDMQNDSLDNAARGLMESIRFAKDHNIGARYECTSYQWLYKTYWQQNRMDSVRKYLTICNNMVDSCGLRHKFTITLLDLSQYHEDMGDSDLSQRYKAEYFTQMDSIFNAREFDMVKNNLSEYEINKVDSEIRELQTKERERAATIRNLMWIIMTILSGTAAVAVLLVKNYRQKRRLDKSYRDLFDLNKRLEANHESATRQYKECLALLDRRESELRELRQSQSAPAIAEQAGAEADAADADASKAGTTAPRRYTASNMSEEMRLKLMRDINSIMDDTLEYCSENFTLDRLSELVGSNTSYVSQVINGYYGKNFNNFVNEYRIRVACARLADEDYGRQTIGAIGQSVGFRSNTTFSAVFRRLTGMTPSVYQKMLRENQTEPDNADLQNG